MAPAIQNGSSTSNADPRPQRPVEKKSELIVRVKYCNTLPDIPFDLKYITYPFQNDRFVQYNPTSLERNYKYEVLTEHDLGVTIDLINRDLYHSDPNAQLDHADEKLLEEDVHTPQDSQRSRHHARSVSWLRKSEYISTEQTRFQPQNNEKVEAKVGFNVRKSFVEETLYMDRETQIKAIQKTFEENRIPIEKHHSKPQIKPVEIVPIYPDFKNWKFPCAQVIFDSDPAPANCNKNFQAQMDEMAQAMIRGVMDESGQQFVAYFLPTEETLEKRRNDFVNEIPYEDDQEYEYKMAREYNWNVRNKASKGYEENYFLVFREDGVYYNELETRVRLSKRRQTIGQQPNNTKLVVKHMPLNEAEHRQQRNREKQLEPNEDEDIEDIEDIEEENIEIERPSGQESQESQDEGEKNENQNDGNESERSKSRSRSRTRSKTGTPNSSRDSVNDSGSGTESESNKGSRSSPNSSRSGSRSKTGTPNSSRSGSARSRSGSGSRSNSSRSRSNSRASGDDSASSNDSRKSRSRRSRSATGSRSGSPHSGSDSD